MKRKEECIVEALRRLKEDAEGGLFAPLENELGAFNLFKVLRIDEFEIRHSNVLGWLLDPLQNHKLGDAFLRGFLNEVSAVMKSSQFRDKLMIPAIDRHCGLNWTVLREVEYRDIQVECEELKLVVCVENKWNAKENEGSEDKEGQLTRYSESVRASYSGWTKVFVFLTPFGDLPSERNQNEWIALSYSSVLSALDDAMVGAESGLPIAQQQFIDQYRQILRKKVGMDSEEMKLGMEIYSKHQKAIESIIGNLYYVRDKAMEHFDKQIRISQRTLVRANSSKGYYQFKQRFPENEERSVHYEIAGKGTDIEVALHVESRTMQGWRDRVVNGVKEACADANDIRVNKLTFNSGSKAIETVGRKVEDVVDDITSRFERLYFVCEPILQELEKEFGGKNLKH